MERQESRKGKSIAGTVERLGKSRKGEKSMDLKRPKVGIRA